MSSNTMKATFSIAIHGGAGVIPETIDKRISDDYIDGLKKALSAGERILASHGCALDAVEAAVVTLENNPLFNAGKGAVFTHDETHEMDASIMDGSNLSCGAVAAMSNRKNPINIARLVMEKTGHVFLSGSGAEKFADEQNIATVDASYFYTAHRYEQLQKAIAAGIMPLDHSDLDDHEIKKKGTVGAVAMDSSGNLAAATSTGGLTNKQFGRIGDTPIIGCGTYANNKTAAISCTGHGEEFIRHCVAYDIHSQMTYQNTSLNKAVQNTIHNTLKNGIGGLIAIGHDGVIVMDYNTNGMFRAWADSEDRSGVKIWE